MRAHNKLTASKIKSAEPGKYSDGAGLWFNRRLDHSASWFLRVVVHGRRREMGLGPYPAVSLAEARQEADRWRRVVREGKDPIKERQRLHRASERELHILADVATDCFESRKAELKGDGKAGRWMSPLQLHVLPKLGKVPVAELDQRDIRDCLNPIWHSKAVTARKALNRLAIVLKHAAALGLDVDIQTTDKAAALLGAQRHKAKHIPSMAWSEVPPFYQSLGNTPTELALRLLILTGMRSGPIRQLHEDQVEDDIWTIPAEEMKGRLGKTEEFRVPLSVEAQHVVDLARPFARDGRLFPGRRKGVISDMTLTELMKRRGLVERPHGFRSSLRDWLAEATNASYEVSETMIAHKVGGSVERAYRRTDYLEQRFVLAERWSLNLLGNGNSTIHALKGLQDV